MARRTLPPLPKTVHSALGPIPVKLVKVLKDSNGNDSADMGEINYHAREIRVVKGLDRTQAHHTLRHEWLHAVLLDSGLTNVLAKIDGLEEQLCDVIATAIVAEMKAKLQA